MVPRCALLVLLLAAPGSAAAASRNTVGFQLQLDGLVYTPSGKVQAQRDADLSALLPKGPGFALTASLGVFRSWVLAARVSYFGSNQDNSFRFQDQFNTNGQPFADGSGPYGLNRELHVTTGHGLLEYRHPLGGKLEWSLEAGGGVAQSRERLVLTSATGEKASAVGVQLDPSIAAGGSLAYLAGWNADVVGSVRWSKSLTGEGAVWSDGDAPSFFNWSLGLRYPHNTH